ncbi:phenylalanine--tRNA ligase subunit beta [Acidithiobacillus sulfuriphilus]|uniref:phenylalanine--tRNA ligase subunit beta n=1 Tax=Acidithiobacillus sulfuriphilus TaxID=1867749 RepID=UPI003F60C144
MRVSIQWLREMLDTPWEFEEIARRLTMGGIEVEGIEEAAPPFGQVVVGRVLAVEAHPQADKLQVAAVDAGAGQIRQVVCGAANLVPEMRVPLALPGAVLPGDRIIAANALRGVMSEGMLCSAGELGLEDGSSGLLVLDNDAPIGLDLRRYLGLDDRILTLGITPNRGDALSMLGVARDLAALGAGTLRPLPDHDDGEWPQVLGGRAAFTAAQAGLDLGVQVIDPAACPRYCALVLEGFGPGQRVPDWLRERLRRAGQRSVHPIVDVMNYVMLELGQPLHSFDAGQVQEGIAVRRAAAGEQLDALDGQSLALESDMLIIADAAGPVALAGIMGGQRTAVGQKTRRILLESAFFAPSAVQGRARRLGLQTEAALRYERGVDFDLPMMAAGRASRLLRAILGAQLRDGRCLVEPAAVPRREPILLRRARLSRILGLSIADGQVESGLAHLGMVPERTEAGWQAMPPAHRFDLRIEADLIEEVGRIYGYERLPTHRPRGILAPLPMPHAPLESTLRQSMLGRDYHEVITYSFISAQWQERCSPEAAALVLRNPLSTDMAVMRSSLWPGLLQVLQFNLKRQQERVRIFEFGRVFEGDAQRQVLAACAMGPAAREGWADPRRMLEFYDLKGDVESLLGQWPGVDFTFTQADHPALHPGQSAQLLANGMVLGSLGALHPQLAAALDLDGVPFLFHLEWAQLAGLAREPRFRAISPFPALRRDLALLVPASLAADAVAQTLRGAASPIVREITLFDRYQGEGVAPGSYSLAFAVVLQHAERTLTEADVQAELDRLITAVQRLGPIQLRA